MDAGVLASVDSAIASGMIVTIPAETIQMGDWVGTGYMVTNPDTMATAYMISGGLNGGYTQEQIEMAFIGNAMLDVLDIALSVAGIVSIVSMFSMGPVGIALGVVFSVLTVVAIGIAVYAIYNNFQQMEAYIEGEISGDAIVNGFIWNAVLTAATLGLSKGVEKGLTYAAERYLTKVVGSRLAGGLLSEGTSPMQLVNAIKRLKALGYTDDFLRELADNISASQLIRLNQLNSKGLSRDMLDVLMLHSRKLGNYSDDLIWKLEKAGGYYDDILKLVDDYGEVFTQQLDMEGLTRLGRLAKEGLPPDVAEAVIKHIDNFADYSNDTIKKIVESGCNADRILTKIDEYAKDFTEDLTAGQLKRIDDILEQGITPEQFEVLLQHADGLENYTDEVVELWRNYGGNSDDFLKLTDQYGNEFIKAFKANGDESVNTFKDLLEGRISSILIKEADNYTDYLNRAGNKIRIPKQTPGAIENSIASRLTSSDTGTALEAKVADYINNNTDATIEAFANKVRIVNGETLGDIDIATTYQLIEVKNSISSVKIDQLPKYVGNSNPKFFNFDGKEVILYIEEPIDLSVQRNIEKLDEIEKMGITVVNGLEELEKVIQ